MIKALYIALLQVRMFLQDRGDLGFSLLLPIITFALMYGAFGGGVEFHGTAHIVNDDSKGIYAERLIEQLRQEDGVDVDLLSMSEANSKLDRSDLLLVIVIPEDFSRKLAADETAQLVIKQRGNGGDEGQIISSIVGGIADKLAQDLRIRSQVIDVLEGTGIDEEKIDEKITDLQVAEEESPTISVSEDTIGGGPDPVDFFLPGILTMYVLFAITLNARVLVEERKKGTLERLLTTRLTIGQLFLGKFAANWSRGFVQALILLALSYAVFQIGGFTSFGACVIIAVVLIAAVSSLGLIIGSIARTEDQATWISVFFTMTMVILSGTFFEISEGSIMETLSIVSINTYANDAFRSVIAEGGSLGGVGFELLVMACVAIAGFLVSRIIFKVIPS